MSPLIYLCDLTHTAHGYTNELIPYPIGCIKSYLLTQVEAEVVLFKDPAKLATAFKSRVPAICGFSNYMWNASLSSQIARAIKIGHPNILIVSGGPNIPLDETEQEQWLRDRPWIDFYLLGEAEDSFVQVVKQWCYPGTTFGAIEGLCWLSNGGLDKTVAKMPDGSDAWPRMTDLSAIPSPYLNGSLDKFFDDPKIVPYLACTRGCPFTCSYCVSGLSCMSKVRRYPMERTIAEARYIAERYKGKTLYMVDDNFGMYAEDVEFSRELGKIKEEFGWPQWIVVSAGKNKKGHLIETAKNLTGSFRVGASVQSMDLQVLANVRRSNISSDDLAQTAAELKDIDSGSYSEVIMGLPGGSKEEHIGSILKLADLGFEQIRMHQLTLFNGIDLGRPEEIAKYGLRMKFRVIQRSHGVYDFNGTPIYAPEIERVVVGSNTFSWEDFIYCRRFALTVALFWNDGVFRELERLLACLGVKYSDFLIYAHDCILSRRSDHPIAAKYAEFQQRFIAELHDTAGEIESVCAAQGGALLRGTEIGNNLLYNTWGHILYYDYRFLIDLAFLLARDFIANHAVTVPHPYLDDLHRYLTMKRGHLRDLEGTGEAVFSHDFIGQEETEFVDIPPRSIVQKLRFSFEPWQVELYRNQFSVYGTTDAGLGKVIARSPMRHTYRKAVEV